MASNIKKENEESMKEENEEKKEASTLGEDFESSSLNKLYPLLNKNYFICI